jgi:putative transposase
MAATTNIKLLRTPIQAPRANAICERFLGSVRRECLDHLLILSEKQLQRVINGYVAYFNRARPHQGIRQQMPDPPASPAPSPHPSDKIIGIPILGGLHHDYRRAA